mmetsp:Transcript_25840/g.70328  ORF Transcript_25840/g.70328 Transcript_25840/m.70328 type:complete len:244 (-) Transcript_25840:1401-2132(-)
MQLCGLAVGRKRGGRHHSERSPPQAHATLPHRSGMLQLEVVLFVLMVGAAPLIARLRAPATLAAVLVTRGSRLLSPATSASSSPTAGGGVTGGASIAVSALSDGSGNGVAPGADGLPAASAAASFLGVTKSWGAVVHCCGGCSEASKPPLGDPQPPGASSAVASVHSSPELTGDSGSCGGGGKATAAGAGGSSSSSEKTLRSCTTLSGESQGLSQQAPVQGLDGLAASASQAAATSSAVMSSA